MLTITITITMHIITVPISISVLIMHIIPATVAILAQASLPQSALSARGSNMMDSVQVPIGASKLIRQKARAAAAAARERDARHEAQEIAGREAPLVEKDHRNAARVAAGPPRQRDQEQLAQELAAREATLAKRLQQEGEERLARSRKARSRSRSAWREEVASANAVREEQERIAAAELARKREQEQLAPMTPTPSTDAVDSDDPGTGALTFV